MFERTTSNVLHFLLPTCRFVVGDPTSSPHHAQNKQTNKQRNKQANKQTNKQTNKNKQTQTYKHHKHHKHHNNHIRRKKLAVVDETSNLLVCAKWVESGALFKWSESTDTILVSTHITWAAVRLSTAPISLERPGFEYEFWTHVRLTMSGIGLHLTRTCFGYAFSRGLMGPLHQRLVKPKCPWPWMVHHSHRYLFCLGNTVLFMSVGRSPETTWKFYQLPWLRSTWVEFGQTLGVYGIIDDYCLCLFCFPCFESMSSQRFVTRLRIDPDLRQYGGELNIKQKLSRNCEQKYKQVGQLDGWTPALQVRFGHAAVVVSGTYLHVFTGWFMVGGCKMATKLTSFWWALSILTHQNMMYKSFKTIPLWL